MSTLTISEISKHFAGYTAVDGFSLQVEQSEFVSLLGPSGCGKTTILRMIAGLLEPDSGRILLGERDITYTPAHRRGIGLVFQSYALFPHLTVFENLAFGLRRRRVPESELRRRVEAALGLVRLTGFAERYPRQLSGGQQQRVALARALAPEPPLLLLDEPLSNLDAKLREEMQVELKRIQRELGVTTVFVTHDQAEALTLSDRVCILDQGRLQQNGAPEDVYFKPANAFVAGFVGGSNMFTGHIKAIRDDGIDIHLDNGLRVSGPTIDAALDAPVQVMLRKESFQFIDPDRAGGPNTCIGCITLRSFAGANMQYLVELEGGIELLVNMPSGSGQEPARPGDPVGVHWEREAVIVLPGQK